MEEINKYAKSESIQIYRENVTTKFTYIGLVISKKERCATYSFNIINLIFIIYNLSSASRSYFH